MVAPVTGPIITSYTSPTYAWRRVSMRQAKPYTQRLPYDYDVSYGNFNAATTWSYEPRHGPAYNRTYAKAWDRFVDKIKGEESQVGVNLAERRQAYNMVLKRVGTLITIAKAFKRGDVATAEKIIGPGTWTFTFHGRRFVPDLPIPRNPHGNKFLWSDEKVKKIPWKRDDSRWRRSKRSAKSISDLWLEYHFGIEPLYKDIYRAIDIMQGDIPSTRVKARATGHYASFQSNPGQFWWQNTRKDRTNVQLIADIAVTNPNLFLANQLGLINPFSIAWELVPFSFVVDWFLPIGKFLSSWTDLAGVTLYNGAVTEKATTTNDYVWYSGLTTSQTRVQVLRTSGIDYPPLVWNVFKGFSPVRGATAIALLVQTLRSK